MHKNSQLLARSVFFVVMVFLAYFPALSCGFIWDDDYYVTNNPLLTAPDGLSRIWFSTDSPSQYFPLVYSVFRLEHFLWGFDPAGYHTVNILFHSFNAILVWLLLDKLKVPGAWLAAAIFALHPVGVESVAWVTELKNVSSLFFILLTLWCWVEFTGEKPKRYWYVLSLLAYALALFSKTTACTLPAALLLILWWKQSPIGWRRLVQVIPFLAMGLGMGLLTVWWERFHQGTQGKLFSMSWLERLLVASHALWFYAGKLFWPVNLTFSYPHWTIRPSKLSSYVWLLLLFGLAAAVGYLRRFAGRGLEMALVFFAVTLSPVLGFIMLYTFRYTYVADHYQYVASIGIFALTAAGITNALSSRPRLKVIIPGILLLTLGILTWQQTKIYQDEETLWHDTLAKNPNSSIAYCNLGDFYLRKNDFPEAESSYRHALAVEPDNPYNVIMKGNLGEALGAQGRSSEAITLYRQTLIGDPGFVPILNNLAWILATDPRADLRNGLEAVQLAQRACELTQYKQSYIVGTLAAAYAEAGRYPEAVDTANKAANLATQAGQTEIAEKNRQLADLYRDHQPFHQPANPAP